MTPWEAVKASDAAAVMAVWTLLLGFICGVAFATCIWWRRITTPASAEEVRRLQADLDDANAKLGHLYAQNERLAERLILLQPAKPERPVRNRFSALDGWPR